MRTASAYISTEARIEQALARGQTPHEASITVGVPVSEVNRIAHRMEMRSRYDIDSLDDLERERRIVTSNARGHRCRTETW